METPKKPVKRKSALKTDALKRPAEPVLKSKRFIDDDDDDDEFDAPIDDLALFDHLDELEEEDF